MVVFLGAWGMTFAALFFSYAGLCVESATWPPDGFLPLPVGLPAINTLIPGALELDVSPLPVVAARRQARVRLAGDDDSRWIALLLGSKRLSRWCSRWAPHG